MLWSSIPASPAEPSELGFSMMNLTSRTVAGGVPVYSVDSTPHRNGLETLYAFAFRTRFFGSGARVICGVTRMPMRL
jgi:hypothetical protein